MGDMTRAPDHEESVALGAEAGRLFRVTATVGLVAMALSVVIGVSIGDGGRRFLFSYLHNLVYFVSLSLGALFFVTLQHLTKAGWSVTVRRVSELVAGALPALALLFVPVLVMMALGNDALYVWVNEQLVATDHLLHKKAAYLNVPMFALRTVGYFALWGALAWFFLKRSVAQDHSGDPQLTVSMERVSAPAMIVFALTATFAAFDWLMSLDPHWFSTIFGVYFFAGNNVGFFALLALACMGLQRRGIATRSITVEHYHDVGKLLFAFVFFWGYIAFSQFMLIWYANIPEETVWYRHRMQGGWAVASIVLLVGHFIIPFLGLLSRRAKRRLRALGFWSAALLVMHWVDLYWIIMPSHDSHHVPIHVLDATLLLGVGGWFCASVAHLARDKRLVPARDPRLAEALGFENL